MSEKPPEERNKTTKKHLAISASVFSHCISHCFHYQLFLAILRFLSNLTMMEMQLLSCV